MIICGAALARISFAFVHVGKVDGRAKLNTSTTMMNATFTP
jgi:hypothetical protein